MKSTVTTHQKTIDAQTAPQLMTRKRASSDARTNPNCHAQRTQLLTAHLGNFCHKSIAAQLLTRAHVSQSLIQ